MNRRTFVQAGVALSLLGRRSVVAEEGPTRRRFKVEERAGLRRFGFPMEVVLQGVGKADGFRLMKQGKSVGAQIRRVDRPGLVDAIAVDFNTNLGPLESEEYELVYGGGTEPGPEPKPGLTLESSETAFKVGHRGGLTWELAPNFRGGVLSAKDGRRDYLKSDSAGLSFTTNDGVVHRPDDAREGGRPVEARVDRQGPLAIALRQVASFPTGGGKVDSNALFTFVSSKSWVEILWNLDDPADEIRKLSFDLGLKLDGPPVNVDFGASSLVYGQMRPDESMELIADPSASTGPRWTVWKGTKGNRSKFAVGTADDRRPVEGWAHAFDKTRCTAFAVGGFGLASVDAIKISGDGSTFVSREFPAGGGRPSRRKSLHLWIHVVPTPVQVGAATSPQAILGPPSIQL